jgi:CMP-N-acetylneuraminic acid synthetase
MKNLNEICFIVTARLSSSRLPNKMLKDFAGTNLMQITIDKVKQSIVPDENFYLSILDRELIDLANKNDVNFYKRSKQSIRNDDIIPFALPEFLEWWDKLPFKYFIIMNACNPLVKVDTINGFINDFQKAKGGLFSVKEHKHWFYKKDGSFVQENYGNKDSLITFNSKYAETLYSNGPMKGGLMSDIGKNIYCHDFQNSPPNLWVYPDDEYIDIDYGWEFQLAEGIYKIRNKL